jgi:hypothetical protein
MLRKTMTPLQLIQNIKRRSILRNTIHWPGACASYARAAEKPRVPVPKSRVTSLSPTSRGGIWLGADCP